MKCVNCGGELSAPVQATVPYRSLPGTLLVGVEVRRCPDCGDEEISIPRIEALDRLLAHTVAARSGRLTGPEIRFLRKHLGWSGSDFARTFDVDPSTVSRWEAGSQSMDLRAEKLLRVSATRMEPIADYAEYEAFLAKVSEPGPAPSAPTLRWEGDSWQLAA